MGMQRVPRAEVLLAWLGWRMWWGRQWGELKATDFPHMHAKLLLQSCPTLCDSMDCSPPGSSVHGILQARVLEWVAISSYRGSSPPRDRICISCGSCITGRFFITQPLGKPAGFP